MNTRITYLIINFFCLTSCDPAVQFHRVIENNSDYTIQLVVIKYDGNSDTITIEKKNKTEYLHESKRGRRREYEDCDSHYKYQDTFKLIVKNNPQKDINADPLGNSNWEFITTKRTMNGGGSCNCKLKITTPMIN